MKRLISLSLVVGFFPLTLFAAGAATTNTVVAYMTGAERQLESLAHCRVLKKALKDSERLAPNHLKFKKYSDHEGNAERWTAPEVLRKHFVPKEPMSMTDEEFFRDYEAPAAKKVIKAANEAVGVCTKYMKD